jgi:hypothetical protein
MNSTTSRRGPRAAARAAAIVSTAAFVFAAASCAAQTGSDGGSPAAPAAPAKARSVPAPRPDEDPMKRSGSTERRATQELLQAHIHELGLAAEQPQELKLRRSHMP